MRKSIIGVLGVGAAMGLSLLPGVTAAEGATVEVMYDMNEPFGATVMTDSSGNGVDGVINPAGV